MTVDEMISKLRAAEVAGRDTGRHLPERHIDIEDEQPEPPAGELCQDCRDFGSCGVPCDECGAPVKKYGSRGWHHAHGAAEGSRRHRAVPQQVYDCALCGDAFHSYTEPDRLAINGEPLYVCPTCSRLEGDDG